MTRFSPLRFSNLSSTRKNPCDKNSNFTKEVFILNKENPASNIDEFIRDQLGLSRNDPPEPLSPSDKGSKKNKFSVQRLF